MIVFYLHSKTANGHGKDSTRNVADPQSSTSASTGQRHSFYLQANKLLGIKLLSEFHIERLVLTLREDNYGEIEGFHVSDR